MESLAMAVGTSFCLLAVLGMANKTEIKISEFQNAGHRFEGTSPAMTCSQTLFGQEPDQVADTARIAPLVVVPRDDLHAVSGDNASERRVDDRGTIVVTEVHRDQFLLLISEKALQRP